MAKPDPQTLYTSLMEEAKSRFGVIESAIEGKLGVPDFIAYEIAFLQLRMLCEIVALACLVAHGDVTPKVRGLYEPDKIIAELEKLNPRFYPQPVTITAATGTGGETTMSFQYDKEGWLTKKDLGALYTKSGQYLHRGKLKKLLAAPTGREDSLRAATMAVVTATNKFKILLESHIIASADLGKVLICVLVNRSNQNRVTVIHAVRP